MNKSAWVDYTLIGTPSPADYQDHQHQAWLLTLDHRLYIAPIDQDVNLVLDIGCGNGSWVLAMAKEHPNAQIIATDLTPPSIAMPANVRVMQQDAEKDWQLTQKFNFIHVRAMMAAIHDWPAFLRRSWERLEPSGWLELQDVSIRYYAEEPGFNDATSSPWINWGSAAHKGFTANNIDWDMTSKHVSRLQALGFVNVCEQRFRWPLGEWADTEAGRRIGALTLKNFLGYLDMAAVRVVMQHPDVGEEEATRWRDEARTDLVDNCVARRYYLTV
ncbi:MAG: hypothetical protein L6R38_008229 [Xanthoria sp. 2 TBL-2021]|nr:MAG: hypothetical protein L6R38_008229 [Xanthoria sp. 2 TBL-2021]